MYHLEINKEAEGVLAAFEKLPIDQQAILNYEIMANKRNTEGEFRTIEHRRQELNKEKAEAIEARKEQKDKNKNKKDEEKEKRNSRPVMTREHKKEMEKRKKKDKKKKKTKKKKKEEETRTTNHYKKQGFIIHKALFEEVILGFAKANGRITGPIRTDFTIDYEESREQTNNIVGFRDNFNMENVADMPLITSKT